MTSGGWRTRFERVRAARLRSITAIVVIVILAGLITHGHYAASGDPAHYMIIARSLAFDRDLDVANDYQDPANLIQVEAGNHARVGKGGALRPVHDVGLPLLAAPFFGVAYKLAELSDRLPESLRQRAKLNQSIALRQLISLLMILVTAALAVSTFNASHQLTGEKALAFVSALVWALSPPMLSHGYVFFTEVPTALIALLVYVHREDLRGDHPGRRGFALGLLTGVLLLIHMRSIGLVAALAGIVLWRVRPDPRRGAGFAAGLVAMGAIKVALNIWFWGTVFTSPHAQAGEWRGAAALVSETALRGFGLLFDARHGLLPSAPVYLLAPAAWFLLLRRSRSTAIELLLVTGAYLVFVLLPVTNIHGWRGGWSPAARFLVPIAPFLALPVPLLLAHRVGRRFAAALVALQLVIVGVLWAHPMLMWTEGPGPAPFLETLAGPSFARAVPVWDKLDAGMLLAAAIGLGAWSLLTWALVRSAGWGQTEVRQGSVRAQT